ncbi:PspC domain-containing protein [Mumia zhuanghuii]|uniref:PspC domain-containing protein n=2 Tax=Mumia TaxID=1546255 RepID=A0ABW1QQR7_9ACTN|nr:MULTISPECIES: PspC domain-containing protein [Mumia]KAA1422341.1 PspC domain-containing protein [Mumia zhuanghuii]
MDDSTTPLGAGTPPPEPDAGPGTRPQDDRRTPHAGALTDIRRTEDGRMVAGVCAGIGRYLGIDPVIPRIIFGVLTLVGFGGVLAYAAAWILLPDEETGESFLKRWLGLGENEPQIRLVGLGAAALVAITWTWGWGWPLGPVWIIAAAVIAWVAYREYQERRRTRPAGPPPPYGPPSPGAYAPSTYATSSPPPPWAPTRPGTTTAPPPAVPFAPTAQGSYGYGPGPAAPTAPVVPPTYGQVPPGPPVRPPVVPPPPRPPKRPNPRHDRGALTVITLSLALIATGIALVTGIGGDEPSVYVAVATGTLALGLLVGTVFGNARPLILPAIVAVGVLAATTAVPHWDAGRIEVTPSSAADLRDDYDVGFGEVIVDLREISDPAALDGRRLDLEAGVGTVRVYVPTTVDIDIEAEVGAGSINALGYERGGFQTSLEVGEHTDRPDLTLDIGVTVGAVEVIRS